MHFLTDFADQAVVLPLALCIGLALLVGGWRRAALAWLIAAMACWSAILLLKLGFDACGPAPAPGVLADPSGHTAAGTFAYAGALALVARRRWAAPAALVIALVIGISRVAVGAHSEPDVLVGGAVGVACVWLLTLLNTPRPRHARLSYSAAALIAVPLLLHGTHLQAEERIRHMATYSIWPLSECAPISHAGLAVRPFANAWRKGLGLPG